MNCGERQVLCGLFGGTLTPRLRCPTCGGGVFVIAAVRVGSGREIRFERALSPREFTLFLKEVSEPAVGET